MTMQWHQYHYLHFIVQRTEVRSQQTCSVLHSKLAHLFNKSLLRNHHVLGIEIQAGASEMNKTFSLSEYYLEVSSSGTPSSYVFSFPGLAIAFMQSCCQLWAHSLSGNIGQGGNKSGSCVFWLWCSKSLNSWKNLIHYRKIPRRSLKEEFVLD